MRPPSVAGRAAFAPFAVSAFDPSAFDPSAFDPSAFAPSAFARAAFARAAFARSACAASGLAALVFCALASGCSRPDAPSPAATGSAAITATAASPAPPSASASAAAAASASARVFQPPPPVLERTKAPTVKEWQGGMELALLGGAGLGCEATSVREWLRVSCRGATGSGGKPENVSVVKGGSADVYTFARNGITSVVFRYLPGTDLEAQYTWNDATSFPLRVRWPKEQVRRPEPVGRFEGAPESVANTPERRALCYCYRLAVHEPQKPGEDVCVGVPAQPIVPECVRGRQLVEGVEDSCADLIECHWMEPSGVAECLPDEVYTGICPGCRCGRVCGKGKPACPDGFECVENIGRSEEGGPMVCVEK